ncbi:alpha/beta fold hydrolase [Demequina muriae]|uniref:Alpha/beta hydrolase n=1 Tax=Demequina muriae TaxID=3051664 RepID=A0ABT8GK21_9MICO|nr:alpha/beta hydrolase [Demequina sp. EGI L300058]MDN4481626.1 alpha/beta hydrolase [Demequina sp. EGI L300058]
MTTARSTPHTTTSADGTEIVRWSSGAGPPLLLVHGAMSDHRRWRIVPHLTPHATVHAMDRRGRGESGDALEWSLDREVADIVAVVDAIADESGSPVDVLGHSLGGLLTLRAALDTSNIRRLVVYEPSVNELACSPQTIAAMEAHLGRGDRAAAVRTMMREIVLMPEGEIEYLESLPSWHTRLAAAHTLPRELGTDLVMRPADLRQITVPVVSILGGDSPESVQAAAHMMAANVPRHQLIVIEGQQHVADQVVPEEFARHVLRFLRDEAR